MPRSPAPAAVVGLGLMGASISACLLAAGHRVQGVESDPARRRSARRRILSHLRQIAAAARIADFKCGTDCSALSGCRIVIESAAEDVASKRRLLGAIEAAVSATALIGSNTSAIPVSRLQEGMQHPNRVVGIHWAEPAHLTRFMEIVRGRATSPAAARRAMQLARAWGKEPTLVERDVPGFIANRIMYAMIREAFHLVESGVATPADVDRSVRNDMGYWLTLAGPFRFMDLTGIPAYAAVMRDLLPDLTCSTAVPKLIERMVRTGAKGVGNCKGFYRYTPAEARRWQRKFLAFTRDIRKLADKYRDKL
ncbi:MAG: 3-hydroxyacyl-CoA dehydrogenase family protein [Bryobacteraceae bacterium]